MGKNEQLKAEEVSVETVIAQNQMLIQQDADRRVAMARAEVAAVLERHRVVQYPLVVLRGTQMQADIGYAAKG